MQKERIASNTQNPLTKKVDSNKRMIAFSASRINPNDNDRIERFVNFTSKMQINAKLMN